MSPGYSNTLGEWPCANNTQYGPTFSDAKSNGGLASDEFASCLICGKPAGCTVYIAKSY